MTLHRLTNTSVANAERDENGVAVTLGVLDSDGETTEQITADPTTHTLEADDDTTGSDNGPTDAKRDENGVPVAMAVSSVDGETPVALYVDSSGKLLTDST